MISKKEQKIKAAWSMLVRMNQKHKDFGPDSQEFKTARTDFMGECNNNACFDAADSILGTIDGSGTFLDCDMVDILFKGNANGDYY